MPSYITECLRDYSKASNMDFNEEVTSLRSEGREVFHFAFGQSPFPVPNCFVEALRENAGVNAYLPVAGLPSLRSALSQFHKEYDGISCSADNFVIGPGSKEIIYLIMRIFDGDILLPTPTWTTYSPQSKLAGHDPILIKTDFQSCWKINPERIDEALCLASSTKKNRLLLITTPGNPSGMAYSEQELKELREYCKLNDIIVLSDEIYARLNFKKNHVSMAKVYPEGTIVSSGFSKWASAGGWRVGYAILPESMQEFRLALISAASHTFSCAPAPIQTAIAKGLQKRQELESYTDMELKILQAICDFCVRELHSVHVKVLPSDGGYYLFPDFEVCRAGLAMEGLFNATDMCKTLLKEYNVALMAGSCFLSPGTNDLTTRFCYVDFDGSSAMEALSRGVEMKSAFIETYAPNVAKGIKNLKCFVRKYTSL